MNIFFVRHGQSESNERGIVTGHYDSPLTQKGLEQARETSFIIPSDITEIYCSDLIRCKQTADILNENFNLPVFYDSRLRERGFGSLEGKTWNQIGQELRIKDKNQEYDYREYGGESVKDVKRRIMDFVNYVMEHKKNENILVVSHGGIIRLLYKMLNNETYENIYNSSVHEFQFD